MIAQAIEHLTFEVEPPDQGVGDSVLFGRVRALGNTGERDVRFAGPGMLDHKVCHRTNRGQA